MAGEAGRGGFCSGPWTRGTDRRRLRGKAAGGRRGLGNVNEIRPDKVIRVLVPRRPVLVTLGAAEAAAGGGSGWAAAGGAAWGRLPSGLRALRRVPRAGCR